MKVGDIVSWRPWRNGQRKRGIIRHIDYIEGIAIVTALPTAHEGFRVTLSLARLTQETTDDRNS